MLTLFVLHTLLTFVTTHGCAYHIPLRLPHAFARCHGCYGCSCAHTPHGLVYIYVGCGLHTCYAYAALRLPVAFYTRLRVAFARLPFWVGLLPHITHADLQLHCGLRCCRITPTPTTRWTVGIYRYRVPVTAAGHAAAPDFGYVAGCYGCVSRTHTRYVCIYIHVVHWALLFYVAYAHTRCPYTLLHLHFAGNFVWAHLSTLPFDLHTRLRDAYIYGLHLHTFVTHTHI